MKPPPRWEVLFVRWFLIIGALILVLVCVFSCGQQQPTTRWSLILSAAEEAGSEAQVAKVEGT